MKPVLGTDPNFLTTLVEINHDITSTLDLDQSSQEDRGTDKPDHSLSDLCDLSCGRGEARPLLPLRHRPRTEDR